MTTRLDIINSALLATGVSPVTSYSSTLPAVQNIDPLINKISRQVQSPGWWFNTDYELTLTADVSGKVVIPGDTLSIDPSDPASNIVRRGQFMYDPVAHTFIINASVIVDVITQLNIEDLPESVGAYILELVTYQYYVNDDGDINKANKIESRVGVALVEMQKDELKNSNVNSANRPAVRALRSGVTNTGSVGYTTNPNLPGG